MSKVPVWSASSSSQSALLQCLSQLDCDTWAEALLPKLIDNGSAGNVALTCAQLRSLCHGSRQQLNLRSLHSHADPSRVLDWTAGLADRFPNCSCVKLLVEHEEDLHGFTYLASALARLPKLHTVKLTVDDYDASLLLRPLSTMLYSLHSQLPSLADLTVTCQEGLRYSALPWRELGRATRLTRLAVEVEEAWPEGHLAALAGLRTLKVLRLTACRVTGAKMYATYAPGQWAFMSALTALTQAYLTVASSSDICSLSGCVALEDLAVDSLAASARLQEVQDSVWESIVGLTRLSSLKLCCVAQHAPSPAFAAISKLSRLQHLGVGSWAPAVLPVLQTLPKLAGVIGSWEAGNSDGVTLTGVSSLAECTGSVPFEAFPSLRSFCHAGTVTTAAFLTLAEHCTGLRSFNMESDDRSDQGMDMSTLAPDEPTKRRAVAIQSLSVLTSLTCLQLAVSDEAELAAVAATGAALLKNGSLHSVTRLSSKLSSKYADRICSPSCLMLLAKLSGLAELHLYAARRNIEEVWYSTTEAAFFLSALCGVREVTIMGDEEQCEALSTAQEWLDRHGLAGPTNLTVRDVSSGPYF